jgi:hypothetical protein
VIVLGGVGRLKFVWGVQMITTLLPISFGEDLGPVFGSISFDDWACARLTKTNVVIEGI